MVKGEWKRLGDGDLSRKLKMLKCPIKKWNFEVFGNINLSISKLEEELDKIDNMMDEEDIDEVLLAKRAALLSQLERWYQRRGGFSK